jgi:cytochrome c peroxidase
MWVVLVAGCWSEAPLVDGAFTPAQWAQLQTRLSFGPPKDPCALAGFTPDRSASCMAAQQLAQLLFVDTSLSVPASVPDVDGTPFVPISCETCHQLPSTTDPRTFNNVSRGAAGYTSRNALSLLDLAYKAELGNGHSFTWTGGASSPGEVAMLVALVKAGALHSNAANLASTIQSDATYASLYATAFPDGQFTLANLEQMWNAYLYAPPFVTALAPFDHWLRGEEGAMSESAKRGFAVFVGRGTCIECHSTSMFTDYDFHATGVPQQGDHVPAADAGRGQVTNDPADTGKFLTPSLRDVARTAPYMHDGVFATLADVIAFYRAGGVATGYDGTKDPRIVPLDLTDDDAQDLEAFLVALTQCDGTTCAPQ